MIYEPYQKLFGWPSHSTLTMYCRPSIHLPPMSICIRVKASRGATYDACTRVQPVISRVIARHMTRQSPNCCVAARFILCQSFDRQCLRFSMLLIKHGGTGVHGTVKRMVWKS